MARGVKNKPPIDICRVRTDRLRDMTIKQLSNAATRVGRLYEIPKRERGPTKPRWVLSQFLSYLRQSRPESHAHGAGYAEWHQRTHGTPPEEVSPKMIKMYREMADQAELRIWDLQQKRGCKIAGEDVGARDTIRSGASHEYADREIRRKPRARVKIR